MMAKREQNRVIPHGRKIPSKYRHESLDTTDGRGPTPQGISTVESNLKGQSDASFVIENSEHQEGNMSRPGSSFSVYRPLPEIGHRWSKPSSSPDVLDNVIQDVGSLHIQEFHSPHVKKKKRMKEPVTSDNTFTIKNRNVFQDFDTKPHSPDSKANNTHSSTSTNDANERTTGSHPRKITRRELRSMQLRRRRSSLMNLVPPEPAEGTERLLIAVRLPAGERIQRYFLPSNTITDVVAFAESHLKESYSDCDVFVSSVPKKKLLDLKSSLTVCDIKDRTLLLLEERYEDENDKL